MYVARGFHIVYVITRICW